MSFPFAALNRLVEVCAGTSLHGSGTDNLSVLTVLDQLVADSMTGLTTGFEDFDLASQEFWGARTSHRVLAIAGLIELGLAAGYLDFPADEGPVVSSILAGPLRTFQEQTLSKADPATLASSQPGIQLFSRLMDRIAEENLQTTRAEGTLASLFESYANLTSYVWSDSAFHQFLIDTHSKSAEWIRDDDLAFLVTPDHFAAAVATGFIGDKEAAGPTGGLAALKYFNWLSDILASAGDDSLADDIVRHARWAHSVDRVAERLGAWASAMSEWPAVHRDVRGEQEWRKYTSRVFEPLEARQQTLEIPEIAPQSYWGASTPAVISMVRPIEEVQGEVIGLTTQGRVGGAQRVAVKAASDLYASLSRHDDTWLARANQLVEACALLSELGDVTSAAAYVAPIRARALRISGGPAFLFETADQVLLKARMSVDADDESASTSTTVSPSSTSVPVQQARPLQARATNARIERTNLS